MKKIIAAAVAAAFVAPVMAADVTIGGDVTITFAETDGADTGSVSSSDILVSVSEELDNGMTVGFYNDLEFDENSGNGDSDLELSLSGAFGEVTMGDDADAGYNEFDNKTDVAESGLDTGIDPGVDADVFVQYKPNLGVDGLSVAIGMGAGTVNEEIVGYGIQYSAAGFAIAFGSADADGVSNNGSHVSASYATGPFYAAVDKYDNYDGVEDDEVTALAFTYNYGPGKIYYESKKVEDGGGNPDLDTVIYGASYMIGGRVNTFVQTQNAESGTSLPLTDTDTMTVGVEYAF